MRTLLQFVVAGLDAELARLSAIRRVLAGIDSISPLDGLPMELNQMNAAHPAVSVAPELGVAAKPAISVGIPAVFAAPRARARQHPENRALTSAIPVQPVAVSAAQVAMERERRTPARVSAIGRAPAAARARQEVVPSVEALRSRWLADT